MEGKIKGIKEKVISLLGVRNKVVLRRITNPKTNKLMNVVMMRITDEQERKLDKSVKIYGELLFMTDNGYIRSKDIYLYGEVNFDDEQDLNNIEKFNLIEDEGAWVQSNFNYEDGTYTTINRVVKGCNTHDKILWFMYNHVRLGKPKRIIVFNENYCK